MKKYVRFGPMLYTMKDDTSYFVFFVVVFALSEVFLLTIIGIAAVAAVRGPIW